MMRRSEVGLLGVLALLPALLLGCGGSSTSGEGSCAFVAHYGGVTYEALPIEVAPPGGEPVGQATLPPCNDTGEQEDAVPELLDVARLADVPPRTALALPGRDDIVLLRRGSDIPPAVAALLTAPACDDDDAPLEVAGPWIGILQPNGETELDLVPPYDITMQIRDASAPGYEGATITLRVRKELGEPLSRKDIESSLWEGGDLRAELNCDNGAYMATAIAAEP